MVLAIAVQLPERALKPSTNIATDSTLMRKEAAPIQSKGKRGDDDVDDLLDEIDSVLEENAEEFVRGYVQKGGSKQ